MKTGKELLINDKFFENTVISKGKGEEIYNTSPNPILRSYLDNFQYTQEDIDKIQKLINYTVVTYIKTDKQKNLMNNIRRWRYTNNTVKEYLTSFPHHQFNIKAFERMKEELISILFD